MKVSTKGRYGVRAMVDLAIHSQATHEPLYRIAERQNMSMNYLEQVFGLLRKSGFVRSIKGAQGGYELLKSPEEVKVSELLSVLEGALTLVDDQRESKTAYQNALRSCLQENVWDQLNQAIEEVVDTITLQDLIDIYTERNGQDTWIYHI